VKGYSARIEQERQPFGVGRVRAVKGLPRTSAAMLSPCPVNPRTALGPDG